MSLNGSKAGQIKALNLFIDYINDRGMFKSITCLPSSPIPNCKLPLHFRHWNSISPAVTSGKIAHLKQYAWPFFGTNSTFFDQKTYQVILWNEIVSTSLHVCLPQKALKLISVRCPSWEEVFLGNGALMSKFSVPFDLHLEAREKAYKTYECSLMGCWMSSNIKLENKHLKVYVPEGKSEITSSVG